MQQKDKKPKTDPQGRTIVTPTDFLAVRPEEEKEGGSSDGQWRSVFGISEGGSIAPMSFRVGEVVSSS